MEHSLFMIANQFLTFAPMGTVSARKKAEQPAHRIKSMDQLLVLFFGFVGDIALTSHLTVSRRTHSLVPLEQAEQILTVDVTDFLSNCVYVQITFRQQFFCLRNAQSLQVHRKVNT